MKYLSLLLLLILSACQSKEDEPDLDYVKMEIFSVQTGKALSVIIDLKNNNLVFDNYGQMPNYPSEGDPIDFNIFNAEPPLDFEYFKLKKEDEISLYETLDNNFLKSIQEHNYSYNNTKQDNFIRFEGLMFQFKIINTTQNLFNTKNYIILSNKDSNESILKLLNIIKNNSTSDKNKKYINFISNYLQ